MAPDGANQLAAPVEADVPPNHALHLVGQKCTEQLADPVARQLGKETTDAARDLLVRAGPA
jgi:hypothetical protein